MAEQDPDKALLNFKALLLDAQVFGVEGFGRRSPAMRDSPPTAPLVDLGAGAPAPSDSGADSLNRIASEADACRNCALGSGRTKCVPGLGNAEPEFVFVGEAPGADEDAQGVPFVGAAGQLLDRMIIAMGLTRDSVFIANVVKCRPPNNREPQHDEVAACMPFLSRQIDLLRPKVVIALGAHAARGLLGTADTVGSLRGRGHPLPGATCVVTYHPAYLLRAPQEKSKAWEDLKFALSLVGRVPPARA